jgi:hypothetical protein
MQSLPSMPKMPELTPKVVFYFFVLASLVIQIIRVVLGMSLKGQHFGNLHTRSDQFFGHVLTVLLPIMVMLSGADGKLRLFLTFLCIVFFVFVILWSNYYPISFPGALSEEEVRKRADSSRMTYRFVELGVHGVVLLIVVGVFMSKESSARKVAEAAAAVSTTAA